MKNILVFFFLLFAICYFQIALAQNKLDKIFVDESTIIIGNILEETNTTIDIHDIETGKDLTLFKKNIYNVQKCISKNHYGEQKTLCQDL